MSAFQIFTQPSQQALDTAANVLSGATLTFTLTGTSTPTNAYSDSALTTPVANPYAANSAGVWAPIFLDPSITYRIVLKTQAGAVLQTWDPANEQITQDFIAQLLYPQTASEVSAGATPTSYIYDTTDYSYPERFGAVGNGSTDDRAAIQKAIDVAAVDGGVVHLQERPYVVRRVAGGDSQFNGLHVPYTNVFGYAQHVQIIGKGNSSRLLAGDNSMIVLRWSDSHGLLQSFAIDANGKTGVTGIGWLGSDVTNVALAQHVNQNTALHLNIVNCAEGMEFESPSAGGCYYNRIMACRFNSNVTTSRHLRFRDNAVKGGANRNMFVGVQMNGGNTGAWIDGADTLQFIACTFEDISNGASPSATPTAIKTMTGTVSGFFPENVSLIACVAEQCTQDLDCGQRRISILGGNIGAVGAVVGSATPDLFMGGDHDFWVRELRIGGTAVDKLGLFARASAYLATITQVATSANASGSFPFENDGSILIQARQQAASGIQLATGTASTQGLDLLGDGSIAARAGSSFVNRLVAVTYSASMTIDSSAGNIFEIVATNGTAFTINAPTNVKTGRLITIVIYNTSGGALGAVTWNAAFKMSAWTQPANGQNRSITFRYSPNSWYQTNQTGVDIPN